MNNLQEILLFPVRDADARKQFLFTCLVILASYFIPLLPLFVLMGYSIKIMRQVIDERKSPSMPRWEESDWGEMLLDGIKLYGIQLVYTLPLFLFLAVGFLSVTLGAFSFAAFADESLRSLSPFGIIFILVGFAAIMLFSLLSLPYSVVISAVGPHMVAKRSFMAGFEFREWWAIFRKAVGQFILCYAIVIVVSFVFMFVMQVAMMTLILMCIVPIITIPYTAYLMLVTNTLYAQAYLAGRDALGTA